MEINYQAIFGFGEFCGLNERNDLWQEVTNKLNAVNPENPRTVEQWKRVNAIK